MSPESDIWGHIVFALSVSVCSDSPVVKEQQQKHLPITFNPLAVRLSNYSVIHMDTVCTFLIISNVGYIDFDLHLQMIPIACNI